MSTQTYKERVATKVLILVLFTATLIMGSIIQRAFSHNSGRPTPDSFVLTGICDPSHRTLTNLTILGGVDSIRPGGSALDLSLTNTIEETFQNGTLRLKWYPNPPCLEWKPAP